MLDFLEERPDGLAGHAAHDLAEQEALMVNVVGGVGAGLPQRLLHLERFHDRFTIEEPARPERIVVSTGMAAVWSRKCRTSVFSLPFRPNSGQ